LIIQVNFILDNIYPKDNFDIVSKKNRCYKSKNYKNDEFRSLRNNKSKEMNSINSSHSNSFSNDSVNSKTSIIKSLLDRVNHLNRESKLVVFKDTVKEKINKKTNIDDNLSQSYGHICNNNKKEFPLCGLKGYPKRVNINGIFHFPQNLNCLDNPEEKKHLEYNKLVFSNSFLKKPKLLKRANICKPPMIERMNQISCSHRTPMMSNKSNYLLPYYSYQNHNEEKLNKNDYLDFNQFTSQIKDNFDV